jgi:hypothetical protein
VALNQTVQRASAHAEDFCRIGDGKFGLGR